MLRNRWLVAAALALTIALGILSASWMTRTTAAPAPSDADTPAFRGKVLLVRGGWGMEVLVMEDVKVRQYGQHAFLLGKVVECQGGHGSLKGKTVWQNMNGITQLIECANTEEAKKMLKAMPAGIGGYAIPVPATGPAVEGTPVAPAGEAAPLPPAAPPAPAKR